MKKVNALILYTNGKYEEKALQGLESYQAIVKGHIEMLPVARGYVNPSLTVKRKLLCYVNEEGMMAQLPSNPWGGLLQVLGVSAYPGTPLFGNVIVFSEGKDGDEGSVDPYVCSLAKEYKECEDEDAFFVALEKLNKKKVVVVQKTKQKRKEEEKVESNKKARPADCWCNDEAREETKKCVVCACQVTHPMKEEMRKAECPYHQPVKPTLFCGPTDFICEKCVVVGWESDAGTGGGDAIYNNVLDLKMVKGKQVALSKK